MPDPHLTAGPPVGEPEPIDVTPEPVPAGQRDHDDVPPRRHRWRRVILGGVLLVGLTGGTAGASTGWRVMRQKDASLATPTEVAGLHRDDSDRALGTADYLRDGLAAEIALDHSIGAVYQDPSDAKRSVLLFGGTTLLWQPERELDSLFDLMADATGTVNGIREVPPGDLGGVMKCGRTSAEDGDFTVCGWADHGSVVLAMFSGRESTDAGSLLRRIRDRVQTRN